MKPKSLFILLVVIILSLAVATPFFTMQPERWWILGADLTALIILTLLYRSVVKPVTAAQRGIELLSAQDMNSRLAKVGEPGADRIVTLFNELITRLKNERLHLREQDSFLKLLVDASPMGVAMLNLDHNVSMVNKAFMQITGLQDDDLSGKKLEEIDNDIIRTLVDLKSGESRVVRYSGTALFRCYHLRFMQEGFRRHFYLVEEMAEAVRKAEKEAYEKVIRMISHEVNNTMGSVESVLEMIAEESDNEPDLKSTIESCQQRCESMCGFIDSFANLARLPEPEFRRVDLTAELNKMLPFLRLISGEKINLELFVEGGEGNEIMLVNADMTMIQQVIVNIVKNAVESIPDKGKISISLCRNSKHVTLGIANDGTPIDSHTASQLFSPFFSTKRSGRGLGLMLVSEILHKHSADYSLRTDPDNITRFNIRFRSAR